MNNPLLPALLFIALLSRCALGPTYHRPSVDMPQSWRFPDTTARQMANEAWWKQFDDSTLTGLITAALRENFDLKLATARIEEFRGRYITARAPLFPFVNAGASAARQRNSFEGPVPIPPGAKNPFSDFSVEGSAGWENDLWGKYRNSSEAAKAQLLGSREARRGIILTLVSSVVSSYVILRELDWELDISKNTAQGRKQTIDLFQLQFDKGIISELELNQAKSEYELALSTIPSLEKSIGFQENALCLLLGRPPGSIPRGKPLETMMLPVVPASLPSALLKNRPDIRQAEQDVVAANALIGVAKASYLPDLSLTGLFGWTATKLSNLFTSKAVMWNGAGSLSAPLFQGGASRGKVISVKALFNESVFKYQQTVLSALQETENALLDNQKSRERLASLERRIEALRATAHFARLRYDEGYSSYIEVLDAERSLFDAELSFAAAKASLFLALIDLYKSLGSGWKIEADTMMSQSQKSER